DDIHASANRGSTLDAARGSERAVAAPLPLEAGPGGRPHAHAARLLGTSRISDLDTGDVRLSDILLRRRSTTCRLAWRRDPAWNGALLVDALFLPMVRLRARAMGRESRPHADSVRRVGVLAVSRGDVHGGAIDHRAWLVAVARALSVPCRVSLAPPEVLVAPRGIPAPPPALRG